ncbi:GNAT family N-acetyltransferase [Anaerorhabdus furcosa]|uniref:Ribosomal protein S18 acetylase RimI n=1 Tax=Anaerorhabdus furcosa TaxID=118967 RepID=A0A1T4Q471_9FIRM|nr:GNAT family N-acetyltransferase [Anaerorhabdus furcosa]SJZ98337.1 Ribosomal protein S18 acetylase RimI [Anaerorhabdus furcosa]
MKYTLREITAKDLNQIIDLRIDFLTEIAVTPLPSDIRINIDAYFKKHFYDGSCFGLVAEIEGKIIAKGLICVFEVLPDEFCPTGRLGKLYSIYTIPEFRGQGIMKELIEGLIRLSESKGVTNLYLTAEEKAISLYQRLGFELLNNEMKLRK